MRGASWVTGAAIVAIGLLAGVCLLGPTTALDTRGGWRAIASGLRRSGSDNTLAGTGRVRLQIPGLGGTDAVVLTVTARPDVAPLTLRASRADGTPATVVVEGAPAMIRAGSAAGAEIAIEVAGAEDSGRALYLVHRIAVERGNVAAWLRLLAPALAGLGVYVWRLRSAEARSRLWPLLGIAVATGLALDADVLVPYTARREAPLYVWTIAVGLAGGILLQERVWSPLVRALLAGAVLLLVGVTVHAPGLNGPAYWRWTWQSLDTLAVFPAVAAAALPLFIARALHFKRKVRLGFALGLAAAGVALTATAALAVQPSGLDRMHAVIESPGITAYYTDAQALVDEPGWLASFPERLWGLHVHARTKPPGPILFYMALIRLFGPGSASAVVGALLIALAAGAAVPAVYALARELGEAPDAAFEAACVSALSPSLILFFPELDQAFPLMTCLLLIAWSRAVSGSRAALLAFGACAFVAMLFSYSFLVLGVAGLAIAGRQPRRAVRAALVGAAVMVAAYVLLYAFTGFDPIATFRTAVANQSRLSVTWGRRYLPAVLHDPLDFALGAGWIATFLAIVAAVRSWRARERNAPATIGLLQVAIVDLTGLLRVEAARVWLLLTPFVAIPAGRELARWTEGERTALYVMMVLLVVALAQNMTFIDLGAGP